jgi:hypothetical protein
VVVICDEQTPGQITNGLGIVFVSIIGWFVFESDDEGGASEEVLVEESDSYE